MNEAAACYASKGIDVMSKILEVDQLVIGKHVKVRSPLGSIDVHASETNLGIWFTPAGAKQPEKTMSVHIQHGVPSLCIWPSWKSNWPFAISANGLQIPKKDGMVRIVPLERLAELVDKLIGE